MDKITRFSLAIAVVMALILVTNTARADQTYRVAKGDNLSAIGKKFGISYKEIMTVNNLTNTTIYTGQVLKIPTKTGTKSYGQGYAASSHTYPKPSSTRVSPPTVPSANYNQGAYASATRKPIVPQTIPTPTYPIPTPSTHTLPPVPEDTYYTYPSVAPNETEGEGHEKRTITQRGVTQQCNVHYRGGTYIVERGDSIRSISRKFGVAFWDLRKENDIIFSKIYPGMVLKIPTRAASIGIAY